MMVCLHSGQDIVKIELRLIQTEKENTGIQPGALVWVSLRHITDVMTDVRLVLKGTIKQLWRYFRMN